MDTNILEQNPELYCCIQKELSADLDMEILEQDPELYCSIQKELNVDLNMEVLKQDQELYCCIHGEMDVGLDVDIVEINPRPNFVQYAGCHCVPPAIDPYSILDQQRLYVESDHVYIPIKLSPSLCACVRSVLKVLVPVSRLTCRFLVMLMTLIEVKHHPANLPTILKLYMCITKHKLLDEVCRRIKAFMMRGCFR